MKICYKKEKDLAPFPDGAQIGRRFVRTARSSRWLTGAGFAITALVISACTPAEPTAPMPGAEATAQAVMGADRAFSQMAQTEGLQTAFGFYMDAEDGKLFRPGEILQGKDAVEADYTDWPADLALIWDPIGAHGAASGDLGVTWGDYQIVRNKETLGSGHYVTAWRMNPDGAWKGVIDIGVAAPRPQPSETEQTDNQE